MEESAAAPTEDVDEAEELERLEQLRLEEEAARRRREEFETAQRRRREQREQEERRRREEAEARPVAPAAPGGGAFDELERRLEQEERGPRVPAEAAGAAQVERATTVEAFATGESAELQIYVGKWVRCDILGPGSKPDTFCVHVVPTTLFDNAAGRSDKDVADVPVHHLRKATAEAKLAGSESDAAGDKAVAGAASGSTATAASAEVVAEAPVDSAGDTSVAGPPTSAATQGIAASAEGGAGAEASQAPPAAAAEAAAAEAAAEAGGLEVGGRVLVRGLNDKPQLNGVTGTLVEKKWKGNWIVDLDGEEGKKRRLRRRWLINATNLEASDKPEMRKYFTDLGRPKQQYYIVGTWNDFVPRRMTWDHSRCCWTFEVRVGRAGYECFQIWLDRDKTKCVHPDTANAGNYVPWELCGPDNKGEGKNWSFGDGSESCRFEVRLFLWEDETPQAVEWGDIEAEKKKAAEQSATDEKARTCPKDHDLKAFEPTRDGYSCSQCRKTFPKGSRFRSCRACDFDLCESCTGSSSGSKASPPSTKEPAKATSNGTGILQDARQFLSDCKQEVPEAARAEPAKAELPAPEALQPGDRVSIAAAGPHRGRQGTVMKVDEDGDPAVRLDSGEAKLFYRVDVTKLPPQVAASVPSSVSGRGLGKGQQGTGKGMSRGLGVLGFRGVTSGFGA